MKSKVLIVVLLLATGGAAQAATTFLADDFNGYADDAALTAAGWTILDTAAAIEDSTWTITNPGGRVNPPSLDGSPTTGNFLISDSDQQSASNPVDSGASHDVYTPFFSTIGGGIVWLHADVSAQLNNNGAAIFDVEVSTDGGDVWNNVFSRVAPGRASDEGATTRLPDNTNTDGYFGRLDVDLSGVAANQDNVQVRFRHYEPNWDWWIALDNVRVDDVAPLQGGPITVFSEDFSSKTLGAMLVDGLNTGTETWTTDDGLKGNRYTAGTVAGHGINRLMHSAAEGPNGEVEFAILDSDANPDPAENEFLMTPLLDLAGMTEVYLEYKDEITASSGINQSVLLMREDNGNGEPDMDDAILQVIFDYNAGGLFDNGEEPFYHERLFSVPEAAGLSDVFFAFRFEGGGDNWWWAVDDVAVTAVPEPTTLFLLGLGGLAALRRKRR
jgi:hypothetical protein